MVSPERPFTAQSLYVYGSGNSLTFGANDVVSYVEVDSGAIATTVASGNIASGANSGVSVAGGTLNLGANLSIGSGGINVEGSGSTLNLAGHNLSANTLYLGYFESSAVTFERGSGTPGTLSLSNLDLGNSQNLSLIAGDRISSGVNVYSGATLTTAASANISSGAGVNVVGGTLNLGANLGLGSGGINVEGTGSTLNLAGHNLALSRLLRIVRGDLRARQRHRGQVDPEHT
jgi:fibronectin-binding autotransporter adhesin